MKRIEVVGLSIKDAHINFGPGAGGKKLTELSSQTTQGEAWRRLLTHVSLGATRSLRAPPDRSGIPSIFNQSSSLGATRSAESAGAAGAAQFEQVALHGDIQ